MESLKIKRQHFALEQVLAVNKDDRKEYKSRVESIGMIIYKNNLIGALAFMKSKNLYTHVENWLKEEYPLIEFNDTNLLKQLLALNSTQLMAVTQETLLFCDALKEFVKAEFKTK